MSDASGTGDPTETLEMDWSHSLQVSRQQYTTSLNLESNGKKEKRATKIHMARRSGSRCQRNRMHLEIEILAQDHSAWQTHVGDLCPRRGDKDFD